MADHSEKTKPFPEKKVDESWKDTVDREKIDDAPGAGGDAPLKPDISFPLFVSTLGMQAMSALGVSPDLSEKDQMPINLEQAQYIIDVIQMLGDKTKGNLSPEEKKMLEGVLYALRLKFVEAKQAA